MTAKRPPPWAPAIDTMVTRISKRQRGTGLRAAGTPWRALAAVALLQSGCLDFDGFQFADVPDGGMIPLRERFQLADLQMTRDLSPKPGKDLAPGPDLTMPRDLITPADLGPARDLSLIDLEAPLDLGKKPGPEFGDAGPGPH